ncbi:MAG: TonB-dependent receptor, partial [Gammaproteobacteria bacterium]|nr:TonB-dependent receptor [Gammaproteobacteria bacterium]
TARLFRANIIKPGTNELTDDFRRKEVSIDGSNFQDLDAFGGSLTLSWDVGDYVVTSITGVEHADIISRGDVDGGFGASFAPPSGPGFIPFPAESADGLPKHVQITEEFRVASNSRGPLNWQGGVYFFFEDLTIDSFNFNTLAGGVQDGFARQDQETTTAAAFLSGTYEFNDRWRLQVGGRISHDEKDFTAQRTQSPIGAGATGVLTANPDDTEFSGDISLNYAATEDINVYARIARGFRAPSVQGRLLFGDTISVADTEVLHSFELGLKSLLLDNRVRANFSLFNYIIDDQQLTAVGGQANFNQLINADQTIGRGFEMDVEAFISQNLTMTAGLSFNDTEIQDKNLAIQPCGGGCTVLDPAGPVAGTVLIDGNRLPQAPRWVANSTLRYSIPLGTGEVFFFTDWAYRSAVNFFLFDSVEFRGQSLLEGGVRLGYQWDLGNQEAALFVRNITDNKTIVGGIDFNNLTGFVNEPRIWGAEYRIGF